MNTEANKPVKQKALSALAFQPGIEMIDDGYAFCDRHSLQLLYCNSTFREWFDVNDLHINIAQIFTTLKTDILFKRLTKRGFYTLSIEQKQQKKNLPGLLETTFTPVTEGKQHLLAIRLINTMVEKKHILTVL